MDFKKVLEHSCSMEKKYRPDRVTADADFFFIDCYDFFREHTYFRVGSFIILRFGLGMSLDHGIDKLLFLFTKVHSLDLDTTGWVIHVTRVQRAV